MRCGDALLAALIACAVPTPARSELVPFSAVLEIRTSVGTSVDGASLLTLETTGVAELEAGAVRIPAGELSGIVPELSGFDGVLSNGPASFGPGGAGAGSSCPLTQVQEVCIDGGGFGGVMGLDGIRQQGQVIPVWGSGGSAVGATQAVLERVAEGRRWTQGHASVWYYVTELDPVTPFLLSAAGSFRGLPSTYTGSGLPGFSVVTPLAITSSLPTSDANVRGVAVLRIDFGRAVPTGGVGVLILLLGALGALRLGRDFTRSPRIRSHPPLPTAGKPRIRWGTVRR